MFIKVAPVVAGVLKQDGTHLAAAGEWVPESQFWYAKVVTGAVVLQAGPTAHTPNAVPTAPAADEAPVPPSAAPTAPQATPTSTQSAAAALAAIVSKGK